ncbi:hypothetical protein [Acinetobacter phage vB_AbaS_TCUP2199]|nr:hypothetical protein [Acinetobacter phage vB_AbaS_TCUP2199]
MRQKYYVFYNWNAENMRMKYDAVQAVIADNMLEAEQILLEFAIEQGCGKDNCYVSKVMTEYQYNIFLASKGPYS